MKKLGLLISCLALTMGLLAQDINGEVKTEDGKSLKSATITLLKASDSSIVKFTTTNQMGVFKFESVVAGSYFVEASNVGYAKSKYVPVLVNQTAVNLPVINLIKSSKNLSAVVVTAKRPIIEMKADKMIVNVEGTVNAIGNDALELLRKSPGVLVDKDDNLSLSGKNGVQVYIDGKPSPLTGEDLANYLKSLQSTQIDALEIITNPSARYEAAGNAGIINIKLKKNKSYGTNGSVTAGYGVSIHSKYNAGLNLNNRNKNTNLFASYNFNTGDRANNMFMKRTQGDSLFDQTTHMLSQNTGHNYKAGLDYFVNKQTTLGVMVNGNINNSELRMEGPMIISYQPTHTVDRILRSNNFSDRQNKNTNLNFNIRNVRANNKTLNFDADYSVYQNDANQYQPNLYYDATGNNLLYSNIYRMLTPTNIKLYAAKVDYEQKFKKGVLGIGAKVGLVKSDNVLQRFNVVNKVETLDRERSNQFHYDENINAIYGNYNRAFKGFAIQAGLRVENTSSKGKSMGEVWDNGAGKFVGFDSTNSRSYTDVFPSAAITFNKNPMSMFNLTYSRRIDRPAYQDLNPFEFKINDYTYMKGNTNLRPQYSNSIGLTHTYKYKLNTTVNYTHVKDIFTQLPDTIEISKSYMTKENLATQDVVSLNISYPFKYKWYSFFANLNGNYSLYKANFGAGDRKINLSAVNLAYYMQNSFKLGKGFTGEISGFYNSPSIWQGTFKMKAMYSIDAGLQKALWKGKANVKMSVSDIFKTMKWNGSTKFTGSETNASGNWESRQFKLNFTYRFGSSLIKAARQRKTSLEAEGKRTETGAGLGGQ